MPTKAAEPGQEPSVDRPSSWGLRPRGILPLMPVRFRFVGPVAVAVVVAVDAVHVVLVVAADTSDFVAVARFNIRVSSCRLVHPDSDRPLRGARCM